MMLCIRKMLLAVSEKRITSIFRVQDGHTIAQAVSRWLPTAAARVRARVWSSGICGVQCGAEAGFLQVLRFPLPIHSTKFSILTITRGRYNGPRINDRRAEWTQFGLHPPLCKIKKFGYKMEAAGLSETLVNIYQTSVHYILETVTFKCLTHCLKTILS
jgi:hypothetical protein